MRTLSVCLLALVLVGCSKWHTDNTTAREPSSSVLIYQNSELLEGKSFQKIGPVSGESCQLSLQDPPPSLAVARQNMQARAAAMQANAVLLEGCQVTRSVAGCRQQAVCQGTALNISSQ
ncbi:Rcs stress response system protein RcsF [Serratia microhaemolytica]|uniref:Rcs stress response system protein RcsF n=1 Tax=Serratia microhaemolytica TaxID=2675110 RepID=UPI000FDE480D|nr:Rcs stress response system protein RcsF [Serratia microhaemolytica]